MGIAVLLIGEFDLTCKQMLRDEFATIRDERSLVIDFAQAAYIDSTCILELVRLHEQRAKAGLPGETLVLHEGTPAKRLFTIANLAPEFHVVASLDEAVHRDGETTKIHYLHSDDASAHPSGGAM